MNIAKVLLIEDDPRIISFLEKGLRAEGYDVVVSRDQMDAKA